MFFQTGAPDITQVLFKIAYFNISLLSDPHRIITVQLLSYSEDLGVQSGLLAKTSRVRVTVTFKAPAHA